MQLSNLSQSIKASLTLSLSAKARAMRARGLDVIALSAGELDFSPQKEILEAGKRTIDSDNVRYTSASGMPVLRKSVADKYSQKYGSQLAAENVIISSGAKQSLANGLLTLIDPDDEVIIPAPYWVSYPEMVKLARGKAVFIDTSSEQGFKITPEQIHAALSSRSKVLLLNSPSNPTGAVYTKKEIEAIAKILDGTDVNIISDEIYENLVLDGEYFSFLQSGTEILDNVLVVSGVSKTYAMTGWRIGWAIGNPQIIAAMGRMQSHQTSNACTISQYAAIEALARGDSFSIKVTPIIRKRRDIALELMKKIPGFEPFIPHGAFYIFCDVRDAIEDRFKSSVELAEYLLEKALVAIIPGEAFGAPGFVRISIAASEEAITEALGRIGEALR